MAFPIIFMRDLTLIHGDITAVDRLNLDIEASEIFGLIGQNGAGKTSTIKMLTTLLPPSAGSATVAGYDIVDNASSVRKVIGYVPQSVSADSELTGYENLLVFAKLFDIPYAQQHERIEEALVFMDLTDVADKLVRTYSGGMIRRLEIAQAMLHHPKVLFLDEPTVGLDPLARHKVWDRIGRLNAEYGSTIVITTHYMDEVEALCDRVAILYNGRLQAIDTPNALKARIGPSATLDDVFTYYTSGLHEQKGDYDLATRTSEPLAVLHKDEALHSPFKMLVDFLRKTFAIAQMDIRKLRHDPTELATRAVQPILWLVIFGQVISRGHVVQTGNLPYIDFLLPGILAQSILFIAIFNGISIIWERDLGIVHKFLASPTPRAALVLGKAFGGGIRAMTQAIMVIALGIFLGVNIHWDVVSLFGVVMLILLGASVFSTFSLIIACLVKTRERFMGIGQVLTMPLFFASNAIYPISMMPHWLQVTSRLNPLTYQVDGLRKLLLFGAQPQMVELWTDFGVLFVVLVVLVIISARIYPNIVR
ncbi:MAG: ABC transporter permease [Sulfurovaceae bacterium]|nr:ABC transporter permease [Sulfurovaceae bacterium]